MDIKEKFRKKVYCKLDSSPLSEHIPPPSSFNQDQPQKKIIPTTATKGVREDFKKTFLPLLIDVFELRQMIENHKSQLELSLPLPLGKTSKSPHEILKRLELLQNDILETKRWCEGVILQIEKGIDEAKDALRMLEEKPEGQEKTSEPLLKKHESLLKKLLKKWKR